VLNSLFVSGLAVALLTLIAWGVRTLPSERWQMLAAIPLSKGADGSWRGLNLTFYGFFSATGTAFGFVIMLLLLGSVGAPVSLSVLLMIVVLLVCIPASRLIASLVEHKRNTFTVAGAAFAATMILPWIILIARPLVARWLNREISILPALAAMAIAYVFGESIGRLACLSFGCCYGMPLRDANRRVARLFRNHNLVISGSTKKAAYASGLAGEPLVPVQAITSVLFAGSGIVGLALFLNQEFRLAALIPVLVSWGWRACSEWLRADYRGTWRISMYQLMAVVSAAYLGVFLAFIPAAAPTIPDLAGGFSQLTSVPVMLMVQFLWIGLFLYYGRSRVTASTLSFHVVTDGI
jgi:hypothetical protein